MTKQFQTFEELTNAAADHLRTLSYGPKSINNYLLVWRNLGRYMKAHEIHHYNASVGTEYLSQAVGHMEYKVLSRWKRSCIRIITALSDFNETGIIRKRKKRKQPIQLDGPIGKVMSEHITHSKQISNLAKDTVSSYQLYLSVFLHNLNDCKIFSFDKFKNQ